MKIRVGHLYPDYLNIYADRGNIAVLAWRARERGHHLDVRAISIGDPFPHGELDLVYIGGGQDREQALVAVDLASKGRALRESAEAGVAFLAVCGGYQLLGDFYRDRAGVELPGVGVLPAHTIAGERRMIGDVLLDCNWAGQTIAGFENHAGRTYLAEGAQPLGRVLAGFGNDGESGYEGCRRVRAYGTYLHGPLLPRNGWFADRLLEDALTHATGEQHELPPLADELESQAHAVAAERARSRGGRF